ncbi:hypothetical protein ACFL6L_04470 [candidate division KSB1 bacterium]
MEKTVLIHENDKLHSQNNGEMNYLRKIGHEINNFLTVIQLRCEMLQMLVNGNDSAGKAINQLFSNLSGFKQYANNLLFLGRYPANTKTPFDIERLLQDFTYTPQIKTLTGNRAITISGGESALFVEANIEILNALLSNIFYLITFGTSKTDPIDIEINDNIVQIEIVFTSKIITFPFEEFREYMQFHEIRDMQLNNKMIILLSIAIALKNLGGTAAAEREANNTVALTVTLPKKDE